MPTGNTTLLGLALPVEGELDGTWGDVVNDSITSLLDSAIAGTTTLSSDADVTLTTTVLAANQARQAILLCTGSRAALRTITAPAQSKTYVVINATTGGFSVKLVGPGPTTGITVVAGESCLAAWNGSDFVKTPALATSTVPGLIELGSDTVQSVAASAVTATASRTYALQLTSGGQAVVNVPWTSGAGTVTSVTGTSPVVSSGGTTPAISLASGYGDTLNPYASKTAATFLAAPNASAGVPTFRTIVAADVPTLNQNTTGSAASATNATNVAVTNDTSTSSAVYPVWVTANTGNLGAKVTSTKLTYVPSSGTLTSTVFAVGNSSFVTSTNYATFSGDNGCVLAVNNTSKVAAETAALRPTTDNSLTCGTAGERWSVVYAATGTINTSDARKKTAVQGFTQAEINAAKQMSKEIGTYKWLEAIAKKGEGARLHIGLTVQRAIEVMQANGLNPFAYGFICYDEWDELLDPITQEVATVAGNGYSFRYDELTLFIARGIEARLSQLEELQA
jgi:hypothetical protein